MARCLVRAKALSEPVKVKYHSDPMENREISIKSYQIKRVFKEIVLEKISKTSRLFLRIQLCSAVFKTG